MHSRLGSASTTVTRATTMISPVLGRITLRG
ncbi:hypothetical protein PPTG_21874 [Phytophthora nicotianae INRA-310]|uniref:Uncharacterized protein n=1 Tax=Phytophthora nicotianae (strain INRA-310) TaxID=761204 RepID=W2QT30_PHYN3|nr:hypothetical protein PPTG_21874 [Phytophthora nicotianae INRA-310]ETN16131.1 hypothetical protein PPTG_21874 [Phytophthora nicotianae INRA-310]